MNFMATVDHIQPKSHGGTNRRTNLVMACSLCNNKRQTMDHTHFLEIRSDPKKWKDHNRALTAEYQKRSKDRKVKSAIRYNTLLMRLAVLFYVLERYPSRNG